MLPELPNDIVSLIPKTQVEQRSYDPRHGFSELRMSLVPKLQLQEAPEEWMHFVWARRVLLKKAVIETRRNQPLGLLMAHAA
jgi:hypothetical protein